MRPSRRTLLNQLNRKADLIMAQQDDINTATTAIRSAVDTLTTATADIAAQLKANQPADLTGLTQVSSDLASAVGAVAALVPPKTPASVPADPQQGRKAP